MRRSRARAFAVVALSLLLLAALVWIAAAPGVPGRVDSIGRPVTMSQRWFAQAYDLDDGEVVRFCPPPYPIVRYAMASWMKPTDPPERSGEMLFHAGRTEHFWMASSGAGTLRSSLAHVAELSPVEWDVSEELATIPVYGDWVMRKDAPRDRRVAAVENILRQVLSRPIVIETRRMSRPAVIVSGSYAFRSLGRGREPDEVQLFIAVIDQQGGSGGGTGTFAELLRRLENATGRRFVDQTTGAPPEKVVWSNNRDMRDSRDDQNRLLSLLANVRLQTGLRFELGETDVDVYCVREGGPRTTTTTAATTRSTP